MGHAVPVSVVQGLGDLDRVTQDLVQRQRTLAPDAIGECLSLEILHHQEVDAVLVPDIVKGADGWMVQTRNRFGLALEPLPEPGVTRHALREDFDSDRPVEPGVLGSVDFALYACQSVKGKTKANV